MLYGSEKRASRRGTGSYGRGVTEKRGGVQRGARIVEGREQHRVQPRAQVRAVGGRRDLVECQLERRRWWILEAQRRLAHLADAATDGRHQLREQPGVPAVQHLE